jgi:hypothetical protein
MDYLPIAAVSARIVLRIPIAVDGRRYDWLRAKLFSAEHPQNGYPAEQK